MNWKVAGTARVPTHNHNPRSTEPYCLACSQSVPSPMSAAVCCLPCCSWLTVSAPWPTPASVLSQFPLKISSPSGGNRVLGPAQSVQGCCLQPDLAYCVGLLSIRLTGPQATIWHCPPPAVRCSHTSALMPPGRQPAARVLQSCCQQELADG